MTNPYRNAVIQVLKEAGEHDRFFDFSDGERLTWMIGRAYELGLRHLTPARESGRRLSGARSRHTGRKKGDRV